MKFRNPILALVAFAGMMSLSDCKKKCTAENSTYYASVAIFDQSLGITTQNFNFTQTQKSFTDPACGGLTSSTDLKITNTTPFTAVYTYTINFHLNLVNWTKIGSITIPSQATIDVGEINQNPASVQLATILVTYSNVQYK